MLCQVRTVSPWGPQSSCLHHGGQAGLSQPAAPHALHTGTLHRTLDHTCTLTIKKKKRVHLRARCGIFEERLALIWRREMGPLKPGLYSLLGVKHTSTPLWSSHGSKSRMLAPWWLSLNPKSPVGASIFRNSCNFISHILVVAGEVFSPALSGDSPSCEQNRGCKLTRPGRTDMRKNVTFLKIAREPRLEVNTKGNTSTGTHRCSAHSSIMCFVAAFRERWFMLLDLTCSTCKQSHFFLSWDTPHAQLQCRRSVLL